VRALAAAGLHIVSTSATSRRFPQRLPSAQAPPRLMFMPNRKDSESFGRENRSWQTTEKQFCRLCGREGQKLFLKGLRCFTEKCADRKATSCRGSMGSHGARRSRIRPAIARETEVKRTYGCWSGNSAITLRRPRRAKGPTGENLIIMRRAPSG